MSFDVPVTEVISYGNHPTSSGENKITSYPDYSHWNSLGNILRFIEHNTLKRLDSWILLIRKESPYSDTMDFMSLVELPAVYISVKNNNWEEVGIINTSQSIKSLIWWLSKVFPAKSVTVNSKIFFWENKEKLDMSSSINTNLVNTLEQCGKLFPDLCFDLFTETKGGIRKKVTPETQVYELCPTSWWDFDEMWRWEQKKDLQKMMNQFFATQKVENWKKLIAWFNFTDANNWNVPTWNDWWQDSQSLKVHHIHFFEQWAVWNTKRLNNKETSEFWDIYTAKALEKNGFNSQSLELNTLIPLDKSELLSEQAIAFKIINFWSDEFWDDFDIITGLVERLNVSLVNRDDLKALLKGSNNETGITHSINQTQNAVDKILWKISYTDEKYNKIIDDNRDLFRDIIIWILEEERNIWTDRMVEWNLIPQPNFWYTILIEKNHKEEIILKIVPRIHTRGAVVEASWVKLERIYREKNQSWEAADVARDKRNIATINAIT